MSASREESHANNPAADQNRRHASRDDHHLCVINCSPGRQGLTRQAETEDEFETLALCRPVLPGTTPHGLRAP
jgi:hypothetical protein